MHLAGCQNLTSPTDSTDEAKFGAGVAIEPDSLQVQIYALLAAQQYGCPPTGIDLHIVQPRRQHTSGPHRMHHVGTDDLNRLFARLEEAVKTTEASDAPRVAGEWCRFCTAAKDCPQAQARVRTNRMQRSVNELLYTGWSWS
jgi:hypothetical protein